MNIFPQILVFSLVASSVYMIIAAGLTLTFGTLEFVNFAHGDMAMSGAFVFFAFYILFGWPLAFSIVLSVLAITFLGIVIEKLTFKPVRDKQPLIPLVLSIGVSIILVSIVTMIFGGGSRTYTLGRGSSVYSWFDGRMILTMPQIFIIIGAVSVMAGLFLFLQHTKTGKAIRAVSDNKQIAAVLGINVDRTLTITFALASALAAFGGILVAFDQNLTPRMGIFLSLKVFAAIVLGGVGSLPGAVVGALIIGFSENFLIAYTDIPGSFKEALVFAILILVLLIRPYGIFGGKKEEIESRG